MTKIALGPVIQVGIVVRDVEATLAAWNERFEMGPVHIVDWPPPSVAHTGTYHGKPANFRMRLAFVETGSIQLEFIQPLEGNNIYADFLEERGEGLHHLLFEADDPQAIADGLQVPIMQSGGSTLRPGAIWAYLDTQETLGMIVELRTKMNPTAG
jgi:methylmalonyl-CoA/ethylmalonyl-CoA epimerase